ncbi:putative signal transducing protein [Rhodothermus profundi]|uniref:Putative signal transducing protein n=1 Tax=Rhodothermus profundi TaxID=633813 RepID=A0A1M6WM57_9BACT|nr:DUF2007 domain-containing protein [Rhodothermus profundi]SHK94664.1 Putative signal transducing protein [Rhodothermus profundi]
MADASKHEEWIVVFQSSTDYEADMVRDRLDAAGIPAIVFTQRDHVFNLNVGNLAQVSVRVPASYAEAARQLLAETVDDETLRRAAEAAHPHAPPAHDPETEARLDSGADHLGLDLPDDEASPTD